MHPTVKPVALVADAILDCSHRKGIVLDAFAGSGTTLVAAHKTGRRGYGDALLRRHRASAGVARLEAVHAVTGQPLLILDQAEKHDVIAKPTPPLRGGVFTVPKGLPLEAERAHLRPRSAAGAARTRWPASSTSS